MENRQKPARPAQPQPNKDNANTAQKPAPAVLARDDLSELQRIDQQNDLA